MKKHLLRTFALLACIFLLNSSNTYASHIIGADLTYTCTSTPGVWHVTLTFYRDCQGIPVCSGGCGGPCTRTISLVGAEGSCNGITYGSNISLSLTNVSDVNINPLCPNAKSICDNTGCVTPGTYTPGIERYVFEGDVDFNAYSIPSSCCKVNIVFMESARNGAIHTGSAGQNFYTEATVNRCAATNNPCNSSPVFTNDPFGLICANERYLFNNGAIDPDGDSLSYAFVPSLQSAGTSVTYTPPYSYDKPMPYALPLNQPFPYGIHCDPLNGDIGFTPAINLSPSDFFVGVVAIGVTQWRNINGIATIVGQTRRDIQMMVQACPINSVPFLLADTIATASNILYTTWEVAPDSTLCFDVIGADSNVADTTYVSWNASLANRGATFLAAYDIAQRSSLGPREDHYQFCWTPSVNDLNTIPYYFTVTAKDDKCPKPGQVTRAFSIKVTTDPHNDRPPVDTGHTGLTIVNLFEYFNLYPNPTTGIINIELKTDEKQIAVEVMDVSGKMVKTSQYNSNNTDFHASLDLTSLKAGMYFITIKAGNKTAQSKFTLK